ncbi:MAG: DUF2062 domain-containing protein [Candidatus Omnitrophica bacterium]|nr:DUF2062 domain-containing protein [Candidatus Omnitrophota bacterium]
MKKIRITNKLQRFFKFIYLKLFRINDSAQKIALGFGLGTCLGIMPGTGPIASLVLASFFRINRASALLGSLLTNTWLSFATFFLALKTGAFTLGLNYSSVQSQCQAYIKHFHWTDIFKFSVLKIILPLIIGYAVLSLALGIITYLVSLVILIYFKKKRENT